MLLMEYSFVGESDQKVFERGSGDCYLSNRVGAAQTDGLEHRNRSRAQPAPAAVGRSAVRRGGQPLPKGICRGKRWRTRKYEKTFAGGVAMPVAGGIAGYHAGGK